MEKWLPDAEIGIPVIADKGWLGGVNYIVHLIEAVGLVPRAERPRLNLIVRDRFLDRDCLRMHERVFKHIDGIYYVGPRRHEAELLLGGAVFLESMDELFERLDFYFPAHAEAYPGKPAASWVPDFQELHLPEYFKELDLAKRRDYNIRIRDGARMAVFSSAAAANDFKRFYPGSSAEVELLHFRAIPEDSWFTGDPAAVIAKYGLPESYLFCCNQFWRHKDHKTLFKAFAKTYDNHAYDLVCTGALTDYRGGGYADEIKDLIRGLGIEHRVRLLGTIDRGDQIQLLRAALAVVQPSLFEGWSTVVEDCRVFGKTLFLSGIDVHREQAYPGARFFKAGDADSLAEILSTFPPNLKPSWDNEAEYHARQQAQANAKEFGRRVCEIAAKGVALFGGPQRAARQAQRFAQSARPQDGAGITIYTSIAPKGFEKQQAAVKSWLNLGFDVVSVNIPVEIEVLRGEFQDVRFKPVVRNAQELAGKPLVYFDDLMAVIARDKGYIAGIVNSDIILDPKFDLAGVLAHEVPGSLVFGSRVDVPDFSTRLGMVYYQGFDFFFFDRRLAAMYPKTDFCIGAPWWDYWIVLVPFARGIPAKRLVSPAAYHIKHDTAWNQHLHIKFAKDVLGLLKLEGIDASGIDFSTANERAQRFSTDLANGIVDTLNRQSLRLEAQDIRAELQKAVGGD